MRRVGGPIPGTPPEWPAALNLTPDEELSALSAVHGNPGAEALPGKVSRWMGGDRLTQQGDGDGAGRKQVWLWAGGTPESESNPDVDGLRNIGIEFGPGFRVKPR